MACTLVPINLHNPDEYAELQAQRLKCGWDAEDSKLLAWREKQDQKLKSFFWITIPAPSTPGEYADKQAEDKRTIRAGHISLDAYADPPDPELACADRSVLTIQTFFILPEYRGNGLGNKAMDLVEGMASQEPWGSPACRFVTVNTPSRRYFYEDFPEKRAIWETWADNRPVMCNVDWYSRRGYVCWKSEPRYRERLKNGEEVMIVADFLRKAIIR
jgi:GNAT superfamily N-acetyltransferase